MSANKTIVVHVFFDVGKMPQETKGVYFGIIALEFKRGIPKYYYFFDGFIDEKLN